MSEKTITTAWARILVENLQKSIKKKRIGRSSSLENSIETRVTDTEIILTYLNYGKFVDMGVSRGNPLYERQFKRLVSQALGQRVGRYPKKWYSPTLYSEVMKLADFLKDDYADRAMSLVKELTQTITI